MSDRLSVLIVDDQAPFRAAMKAVLKRAAEFELVGEAANGSEAVTLVVARPGGGVTHPRGRSGRRARP